MLRPLLVALQFLTRLPVSAVQRSDRDTGRSMLFYPLVGLLLGLLLAVVSALMRGAAPGVIAAVLLALWVFATGALHLDGLADSADAWIGGLRDRQRTLDIMQDPHCGPVAIVVVVVILIAKFAALEALVAKDALVMVATAPVLGRTVLPLLFVTTPYVRPGGIGSVLAEHLPRKAATVVVIGAALAAGMASVWMLVAAALVFVLARAAMLRRIGGTTGDTAGAMLELVETGTLVAGSLT
ncbi:MAG TPA: adenosylcobinamide-GDP ribazoletransferase [Burkholderiales bacterium]|nr:adenosylcobinamide-GDP ribazoletransferase [Burkholderiales bacterium]